MALDPGGQKEQSITQHELALAGDLFKETVKNRMIPPTITPDVVDEIGIPGHKVVVREVMKKFGRLDTFSTEYSGANLPDADRARIASRYKRVVEWQRRSDVGAEGMKRGYPLKMDNLKIAPTRYSPRLHCLVIAHTPEWKPQDAAPVWNEDSQSVFFYLSDILGPTLGFNYDASTPNSPGDYNLLVAWAFKNVEKIKQLYLKKDDPAHLDTQLARGIGVELNTSALEDLSMRLQITTEFSLQEAKAIAKLGLSNAELVVAPSNSTVWDFENLFVKPDQHGGIDGFGAGLSEEYKQALGEEGIRAYCERLNFLSLLNLAILKDIPGKSEPIKKLDAKLGLGGKLPEMLNEFLLVVKESQLEASARSPFREGVESATMLDGLANLEERQENILGLLNPLRDDWGGKSLASALKDVLVEMSRSEHIGLGSGRALLVQYNELAAKKGVSEGRLIHLMGMMVKIAKKEGNFGLDKYYDEILK